MYTTGSYIEPDGSTPQPGILFLGGGGGGGAFILMFSHTHLCLCNGPFVSAVPNENRVCIYLISNSSHVTRPTDL